MAEGTFLNIEGLGASDFLKRDKAGWKPWLESSEFVEPEFLGWLGIPVCEFTAMVMILEKHRNDCSPIVFPDAKYGKTLFSIDLNPEEYTIEKGYPLVAGMEGISFNQFQDTPWLEGETRVDEAIMEDGAKELMRIIRQMKKCGKRFIPIPLGLPEHRNMLLVDLEKGIVERFEPHGGQTGTDVISDKLVNKMLGRFFKHYTDWQYKRPLDMCPKDFKGFQEIEGWLPDKVVGEAGNFKFVPVGDVDVDVDDPQQFLDMSIKTGGFCASWSFLYLDARLTNPSYSTEKIYRLGIKNFITQKQMNKLRANKDYDEFTDEELEAVFYRKLIMQYSNGVANFLIPALDEILENEKPKIWEWMQERDVNSWSFLLWLVLQHNEGVKGKIDVARLQTQTDEDISYRWLEGKIYPYIFYRLLENNKTIASGEEIDWDDTKTRAVIYKQFLGKIK